MLQVVEAACEFAPDMGRGIVVIESDQTTNFGLAIEELASADARNAALGFAASKGMGDPRINGNPSGVYPINSQGLSLENVRGDDGKPLPQTHPRMQPARYRVDIPVTRRLV